MGPKAKNMPVFNAKAKLARGEIKLEDIPYMQRGGSWDNSDVKGARKNKWTQADASYDKKGFKESKGLLGRSSARRRRRTSASLPRRRCTPSLAPSTRATAAASKTRPSLICRVRRRSARCSGSARQMVLARVRNATRAIGSRRKPHGYHGAFCCSSRPHRSYIYS